MPFNRQMVQRKFTFFKKNQDKEIYQAQAGRILPVRFLQQENIMTFLNDRIIYLGRITI